jgi:hypothetical protein
MFAWNVDPWPVMLPVAQLADALGDEPPGPVAALLLLPQAVSPIAATALIAVARSRSEGFTSGIPPSNDAWLATASRPAPPKVGGQSDAATPAR